MKLIHTNQDEFLNLLISKLLNNTESLKDKLEKVDFIVNQIGRILVYLNLFSARGIFSLNYPDEFICI